MLLDAEVVLIRLILLNGVLKINKSATIGDVFNNYKYVTNGEWKIIHDQQNRTIVQFSGIMTKQIFNDIDEVYRKFYDKAFYAKVVEENPIHKIIDKVVYIARFTIDKDNATKFKLSYSGLMFIGYNNEERDMSDYMDILENIYKNNDNFVQGLALTFFGYNYSVVNNPNFCENK